MTHRGRLAFANARARAIKSRLAGRDMVRRVPQAPALAAVARRRFQDLVAAYATLIDSYPHGQPLFFSLLRRHEIENVALAWRAVMRRVPRARMASLWMPLGTLATITLDMVQDARSLTALADALRRSPYGPVADAMRRAHPDDLAAAELGLDAWASRQIEAAAQTLATRDTTARNLARAVTRERDLNVVRRARTYALPPDGLVAALACLPGEVGGSVITELAAWTEVDGPLWTRLTPSWVRRVGRPAGWDALMLAVRRARRDACRRAFLTDPFCLGPGVAVVLLLEEEVRGWNALFEAGGTTGHPLAVERALAAGVLGA